MAKNKDTTSIKITRNAKMQLDRISEERGVGLIQLASRTMLWFAAQCQSYQSVILNQVDFDEVHELVADQELLEAAEARRQIAIKHDLIVKNSKAEKIQTILKSLENWSGDQLDWLTKEIISIFNECPSKRKQELDIEAISQCLKNSDPDYVSVLRQQIQKRIR
jgi:hypothetical protein